MKSQNEIQICHYYRTEPFIFTGERIFPFKCAAMTFPFRLQVHRHVCFLRNGNPHPSSPEKQAAPRMGHGMNGFKLF